MGKAEYKSAIRSRKLIKEALADLLQEKPLDKITVTDVVKRAEINRGTFYAHYVDIPDVINHIIQETFLEIKKVISQHSNSVPHTLLHQLKELLFNDFDFYNKIMNSSASLLMQDQLIEIVLDYLIQHEDDFSFGNPEHYALTIRFCAGGLGSLYMDWFAGKLPYTLDELTDKAELLLNQIISTNNSHKERTE